MVAVIEQMILESGAKVEAGNERAAKQAWLQKTPRRNHFLRGANENRRCRLVFTLESCIHGYFPYI
jgi:hypothetical protein